jgi:hypothetical protein
MSIMRICDECDGEGRLWKSRYGGNDPDVSYAGRCEKCHEGTIEVFCEGIGCREPATEMVTFEDGKVEPYCQQCAMQARIDAGMVA